MDDNIRKYLVENGIDIMQVRVVDIPTVVLKLMQYAETLKNLDGDQRKELVLNIIKTIALNSRLSTNDLQTVSSIIDSYIAIDKSIEIIHKTQGCCTVS